MMKSTELRSFLTGLILGDGRIDHGVQKRAFEIASINYDFIEMIDKELSSTTNFSLFIKEKEASIKDGVQRRKAKILRIKAHPYFAKKYHHFYDDYGKRKVTEESLKWLDHRGVANWFMSDGYVVCVGKTKEKIVDRRVELCTDRYSLKDVQKISSFFNEKFGYKNVIKKRGEVYRIKFSLMSAQNMFVNIKPYVVDSFLYKLNMRYDQRPKWMTDEYFEIILSLEKLGKHENPYKMGYDIV